MPKLAPSLLFTFVFAVSLAQPQNYSAYVDPFIEDLVGIGVDRILTSGQQPSALEGLALIRNLVLQSGGRIVIMPGAGINEGNVKKLLRRAACGKFTSARRESTGKSG